MAEKLLTLSHLTSYDGLLKDWVTGEFKIVPLDEATAGFAKTYQLQVKDPDSGEWTSISGSKIDIPKDFLVKSATVRTATAANTPIQGLAVGNKYFDFEINAKDLNLQGEIATLPTAAAGNEGYIYKYTGETTAEYTQGNYYICVEDDGSYSWTSTTVTSDHIYLAVTDAFAPYSGGDGIVISGSSVAVDSGNGLTIASEKLVANLSDNLTFTSGAIDIKTQNASSASDTNAPAVGGITKADYVGFNGAIDTIGSATTSDTIPTAASGKNETVGSITYTYTTDNVGNTTATPSGSFTVTEHYVTYGEAIAADTANNITAKSGLMTGAEKANLAALQSSKSDYDAIVTALGNDVSLAENSDIEALFS